MAISMHAAETDSPSSQSKPWFVSEANLPEGFPAAGPVDEVIVKTYPASFGPCAVRLWY